MCYVCATYEYSSPTVTSYTVTQRSRAAAWCSIPRESSARSSSPSPSSSSSTRQASPRDSEVRRSVAQSGYSRAASSMKRYAEPKADEEGVLNRTGTRERVTVTVRRSRSLAHVGRRHAVAKRRDPLSTEVRAERETPRLCILLLSLSLPFSPSATLSLSPALSFALPSSPPLSLTVCVSSRAAQSLLPSSADHRPTSFEPRSPLARGSFRGRVSRALQTFFATHNTDRPTLLTECPRAFSGTTLPVPSGQPAGHREGGEPLQRISNRGIVGQFACFIGLDESTSDQGRLASFVRDRAMHPQGRRDDSKTLAGMWPTRGCRRAGDGRHGRRRNTDKAWPSRNHLI